MPTGPGARALIEAFEHVDTALKDTERTEPAVLANERRIENLLRQQAGSLHVLRRGQQVFVLSWRNPDRRHAGWGLDAYVQAVLDALDADERVCRGDRTVFAGTCSGGILASLVAAYLAGTGRADRLAGLVLAVTVLDQRDAGMPADLTDRYLAAAATALSRRRGFLDGRVLAEVLAWLRPGDLVWPYWINNYLLGHPPPAFDILFWNVLGIPVDVGRADVDAYVVAGIADHITPWQSCYRSCALLGGDAPFVLSTSGHIAALVNPPGNAKATFRTNVAAMPADPQDWLRGATTRAGSWWPDLADWLGARCGPDRPAPKKLGTRGLAPLIAPRHVRPEHHGPSTGSCLETVGVASSGRDSGVRRIHRRAAT